MAKRPTPKQVAANEKRKNTLSPQQERFVAEYLVDLNATAAYRRAGYKPRTDAVAASAASELLRLPKVAVAVAAGCAAVALRLEISAQRVLEEYALVGFSDIGRVLDFTGTEVRLKPAFGITEEARRTIASMKVSRHTEGAGDDATEVEVTEFKMWDKLGALAKLGQHLGLFPTKVEVGGTGIPIQIVGIEVVAPSPKDSPADDSSL